ncbi:hypothetical protein HanPSC8_Chr11g0485431 [Helianthus annuus]|nr:hypothetical protein HanPSC8_Chr11g0485431 [Helianthus annuus]
MGSKFRLALDCDALQYKELTLEFHATFQYKQGNYAQPNVMSFSLGRQVHEMTIPQFEVATQFYTQEEVETEAFAASLRGVFVKQHENSLMKNEPTNVASVLAWSMKRTWRGGTGAGIYCGPYVTKLAESLGVFNRYPGGLMRKGPASSWIGLKELQGSGIVTLTEPFAWEPIKQGPQVQPPPDTEAASALQAGVPTRYQRPPQRAELPGRQYPLAQPRPVPLALDSLYDIMEMGFVQLHGYIGSVRQLMDESRRSHEAGQRRLEDGMWVIMESLHLQPPISWQPQ